MARVLVVDDDVGVCASIRDLLKNEGHDVVTRPGAKEAMDFLKKEGQNLDVAVIDMFMEEETSGLKLIKFITRRRLPIASIVLTGRGTTQNVRESLDAGACDYVTKGGEEQPERLRLAVQGAEITARTRRRTAQLAGRVKSHISRIIGIFRELEGDLRRLSDELPDIEEQADERADN